MHTSRTILLSSRRTDSGSLWREAQSGQRWFQPCTAYNMWMLYFLSCFRNIPFHFIVDLNSLSARSRRGHFVAFQQISLLHYFVRAGGPSLVNTLFFSQMFIFGLTPLPLRIVKTIRVGDACTRFSSSE